MTISNALDWLEEMHLLSDGNLHAHTRLFIVEIVSWLKSLERMEELPSDSTVVATVIEEIGVYLNLLQTPPEELAADIGRLSELVAKLNAT